ncbi:molybdopterin adenylyltransferase [Chloroflexota bacterium]
MLSVGILTISDKGWQGQRYDESGKVIRDSFSPLDSHILKYEIIPDEMDVISHKLAEWADKGDMDIIMTTGGTGLSQRDVTPEATLSIVDKAVPGFAEAMRAKTFEKTPMAILSRATAGVRGKCLIINLPGSPKAVRECLEVILPAIPHAVEIIKGEVTEHTLPDTGRNSVNAH